MYKVLFVMLVAALTGCGDGKKIGIAACDHFVEKERACGLAIGGEQGTGLRKQADMMFDAWKQQRDSKVEGAYLEETCVEALHDATRNLPQCDWK